MSTIIDIDGVADISSQATLLDFTYDGAVFGQLAIRVGLGGGQRDIAGNDNYYVHIYINSHLIVPDSMIQVAEGVKRLVASSRTFLVRRGDNITVKAIGTSEDINVNFSVIVFNFDNSQELISAIDSLMSQYTNQILDRIGTSKIIQVIEKQPTTNEGAIEKLPITIIEGPDGTIQIHDPNK